MNRPELFNDFEKKLKAVDPCIELFRFDYSRNHLTQIVIRFPSENNLPLMQKMIQMGWKAEREESVPEKGKRKERNEIKGWIPQKTGKKYLRMSFSAKK